MKAIVAVAVVSLASLAGCEALSGPSPAVLQAKTQLEAATTQLAETRAFWEEQNRNGTSAEQVKAQETLKYIEQIESKLTKVNAVVSAATNPDGSLNVAGGATAAGAALPPPWNLLVMVGLPAIVGVIQQLRVKSAQGDTASLVNAIDALRAESPEVKPAMKAHKAVITGQLTPGAKAVIEAERIGH